ncbi:MAG: patatin-like phospholipase family protein, partial [Actinomycetota bacterium]|nr:patatin-like phospholipase family protein [Actinomycetota bacterium]
MTTIGLVLGAGGLHAAAHHAGTLAALAEATGWDPRTADVVVGTSAGATTAVSLRAGLSAADHRSYYSRTPLSAEGQALVSRVTTPLDLKNPSDQPARRLPANPMLVVRELLSTGRPRPVVSLAGLLPIGTHDGSSLADRMREMHPDRWPDHPTWICAVDLDSGRRVVLGRDDVDTDVGSAVQASSAVPGWFVPVEVDGRRLVDGG